MIVVAIDGPAGSGKSTVARGVAAALGLPPLDTGAMYRAVTHSALEAGVPLSDEGACAEIAAGAKITIENGTTRLDGRDVSDDIRSPEVTAAVSTVAAHPGVRAILVRRQRERVAAHGGGVVEGRDIGTVVFPDATVKVFLTASENERARRRQREEAAAERSIGVGDVRAEIERRDALDSARAASPLRAAHDAVVIDTTNANVDEIVAAIVSRVRKAEAS